MSLAQGSEYLDYGPQAKHQECDENKSAIGAVTISAKVWPDKSK